MGYLSLPRSLTCSFGVSLLLDVFLVSLFDPLSSFSVHKLSKCKRGGRRTEEGGEDRRGGGVPCDLGVLLLVSGETSRERAECRAASRGVCSCVAFLSSRSCVAPLSSRRCAAFFSCRGCVAFLSSRWCVAFLSSRRCASSRAVRVSRYCVEVLACACGRIGWQVRSGVRVHGCVGEVHIRWISNKGKGCYGYSSLRGFSHRDLVAARTRTHCDRSAGSLCVTLRSATATQEPATVMISK